MLLLITNIWIHCAIISIICLLQIEGKPDYQRHARFKVMQPRIESPKECSQTGHMCLKWTKWIPIGPFNVINNMPHSYAGLIRYAKAAANYQKIETCTVPVSNECQALFPDLSDLNKNYVACAFVKSNSAPLEGAVQMRFLCWDYECINLKWSTWLNKDGPYDDGDVEIIGRTITRQHWPCPYGLRPLDVECRTVDGRSLSEGNNRFLHCDLDGFKCSNSLQNECCICEDYAVRFLCIQDVTLHAPSLAPKIAQTAMVAPKITQVTTVAPVITQALKVARGVDQAPTMAPVATQATTVAPEITQTLAVEPEATRAIALLPERSEATSEETTVQSSNLGSETTPLPFPTLRADTTAVPSLKAGSRSEAPPELLSTLESATTPVISSTVESEKAIVKFSTVGYEATTVSSPSVVSEGSLVLSSSEGSETAPVKSSTMNLEALPVSFSKVGSEATQLSSSSGESEMTPVIVSSPTMGSEARAVTSSTTESEASAAPSLTVRSEAILVPTLTVGLQSTPLPSSTVGSEATSLPSSTIESEATSTPTSNLGSEASTVPSSAVESEAIPVPSSAVESEAALVPSSTVGSETTSVQSSSMGLEASGASLLTVRSEATLVPSSTVRSETTSLPSSTIESEANSAPSSNLGLEASPVSFSGVESEATLVPSSIVGSESTTVPSSTVASEATSVQSLTIGPEAISVSSSKIESEAASFPSSAVQSQETTMPSSEVWTNVTQLPSSKLESVVIPMPSSTMESTENAVPFSSMGLEATPVSSSTVGSAPTPVTSLNVGSEATPMQSTAVVSETHAVPSSNMESEKTPVQSSTVGLEVPSGPPLSSEPNFSAELKVLVSQHENDSSELNLGDADSESKYSTRSFAYSPPIKLDDVLWKESDPLKTGDDTILVKNTFLVEKYAQTEAAITRPSEGIQKFQLTPRSLVGKVQGVLGSNQYPSIPNADNRKINPKANHTYFQGNDDISYPWIPRWHYEEVSNMNHFLSLVAELVSDVKEEYYRKIPEAYYEVLFGHAIKYENRISNPSVILDSKDSSSHKLYYQRKYTPQQSQFSPPKYRFGKPYYMDNVRHHNFNRPFVRKCSHYPKRKSTNTCLFHHRCLNRPSSYNIKFRRVPPIAYGPQHLPQWTEFRPRSKHFRSMEKTPF